MAIVRIMTQIDQNLCIAITSKSTVMRCIEAKTVASSSIKLNKLILAPYGYYISCGIICLMQGEDRL